MLDKKTYIKIVLYDEKVDEILRRSFKMEKLLEKELIKECGMLIEEAINEVEPNEKLASLYAGSLKGFMSHNYEAGEKSLDLYLKELIKIKINELAEESLRGNYNDEKSINLCLKKISKISGKKAE